MGTKTPNIIMDAFHLPLITMFLVQAEIEEDVDPFELLKAGIGIEL